VTRPYRVLIFDLFGTVVHFRTAVPYAGGPAYDWLRRPLADLCPELELDGLAAALLDVSREIAAARPPHYREVPSSERFRRALARLRQGGDHVATAGALSEAHMAHLAAQTELPAGHGELLRELAGRRRLGLLSNFDHGPTARAILARHAIAPYFASIVISAEHGRRKPHPAIFETALAELGVAASEALYIGDTHEDDVVGARAAGIDVAWLDRMGRDLDPPPTHRIAALPDLRALLGD
jgi:putative hydrolase of the HAD superfamily